MVNEEVKYTALDKTTVWRLILFPSGLNELRRMEGGAESDGGTRWIMKCVVIAPVHIIGQNYNAEARFLS